MKKRGSNHNTFFLLLLLASMTVASPFIYYKIYKNKMAAHAQEAVVLPETAMNAEEEKSTVFDVESTSPTSSTERNTRSESLADSMPSQQVMAEEEEMQSAEDALLREETQSNTGGEHGFYTADTSYFDDALFIGDSRTKGIEEYGNINNATFFADTGMSVKDVVNKKYDVRGKGKVGLDELLASRRYAKVYLMFGVNELGYPYEEFTQRYVYLLEKVREAQPDALIFVQANLHVTSKKSNSGKIYTNEKLNTFNAFIAGLADNQKTIYIDVNEIFDDESGYLKADLSNDGVHIYGKYYTLWTDWLLTKAR